jgi:hypothetical protein
MKSRTPAFSSVALALMYATTAEQKKEIETIRTAWSSKWRQRKQQQHGEAKFDFSLAVLWRCDEVDEEKVGRKYPRRWTSVVLNSEVDLARVLGVGLSI